MEAVRDRRLGTRLLALPVFRTTVATLAQAASALWPVAKKGVEETDADFADVNSCNTEIIQGCAQSGGSVENG